MKQKLLLPIVALSMAFMMPAGSILPYATLNVEAATYVVSPKNFDLYSDKNIMWSLDTEGILRITGDDELCYIDSSEWESYRNNITEVYIEDTVKTNKETSFSEAFKDCKNLKKINVIPECVTYLREAFSGCVSLTDVPDLPIGITDYTKAFYNCSSLEIAPRITSDDNNRTSIDMQSAFEGCISLKDVSKITIPKMATNLRRCFYGCTSLVNANSIDASKMTFKRYKDGEVNYSDGYMEEFYNLKQMFANCTNLKYGFAIPDYADCTQMYTNCEEIQFFPDFPEHLYSVEKMFSYPYSYISSNSKNPVLPVFNSIRTTTNGAKTSSQLEVFEDKNKWQDDYTTAICSSDLATAQSLFKIYCHSIGKYNYENEYNFTDVGYVTEGNACTLSYDLNGGNNKTRLPQFYVPAGGGVLGAWYRIEFSDVITKEGYNTIITHSGSSETGGVMITSESLGNISISAEYETSENSLGGGYYACQNIKENGILVEKKMSDYYDSQKEAEDVSGYYGTECAYGVWKIDSEGNLVIKLDSSKTNTGSFYIDSAMEEIRWADYSKDIKGLVVEDGIVINNMDRWFENCTSLETAPEIPDKVESLKNTFADCTSLKTGSALPKNADCTGSYRGCINLTTVPEFPNTIKNMTDMFNGCTNLESIPTIHKVTDNSKYAFLGTKINTIKCDDTDTLSMLKDLYGNTYNVINPLEKPEESTTEEITSSNPAESTSKEDNTKNTETSVKPTERTSKEDTTKNTESSVKPTESTSKEDNTKNTESSVKPTESISKEDNTTKETESSSEDSTERPTENPTVKPTEKVEYSIKYILNGGISTTKLVTSYTDDMSSFELSTVNKNGYEFIGWTGSNGENPEKKINVNPKDKKDLVFIANFKPVTYSIKYNLNGGSLKTMTKLYTIESQTIKIGTPVRTGYTFYGWKIGSKTTKSVTIKKGSTGNITLTAVWKLNGIKKGSTKKIGNITYKASASTLSVVKITGKRVSVPSTVKINNKIYKVTSIAPNAAKGNKTLERIVFGKNIKSIGANAFNGCKKLKYVKFNSKAKIGKNAFKNIHRKARIIKK